MRTLLLSLLLFLSSTPLFASDKDTYLEVSPMVAFQTSDALRTATIAALSLTYHLDRIIWFGVDGFLGKTAADTANGTGIRPGKKFLGLNGAFYFNLPALLGAASKGDEGLPADLYTSIGVGNYWFDQEKAIYGFVGGGILIHTPYSWLSFRFDLKGLFYMLDNRQGGNFNSDMTLSLGPSLTF